MTQGRLELASSARTYLTMLVLERGYRGFDVLGPFTGRLQSGQYVVTIYDGDNVALHMLRGTVEELRDQITALPQG